MWRVTSTMATGRFFTGTHLLEGTGSWKVRQINCLLLDATTQTTGAASGDETDLLTGDSEARHSSGMTNVLMVTTTVRVIDGVHCDTSDLGPAVALDSVLVELVTSLQDGLVNTTATGDQTDDSAAL